MTLETIRGMITTTNNPPSIAAYNSLPSENPAHNLLEEEISRRWEERRSLAKLKREKDRLIIQNRVHLEPFPVGTFEKLRGNQVWEEVLSYFCSGSDLGTLGSLYSTCPTFQSFLEPKILTEIFRNVKDNRVYLHRLRQFSKFAWSKDVYNLRLVSKTWKCVLETLFMNPFNGDWHVHFFSEFDFHEWFRNGWGANISSFSDIESIMDVIKNSSQESASALTRILRVKLSEDEDLESFHCKIVDFLGAYGDFVKALIIHWNADTTFPTKYKRLCEIVTRMSNLKVLWMKSSSKSGDNIKEEDCNHELFQEYSFPSIPSLKVIGIEDNENESLVTEILSKSPNVRSLKFPTEVSVTGHLLRVMESLNLECYDVKVWYRRQYDLLQRVSRANSWPLKRLRIIEDGMQAVTLFDLLSLFGNTLEYLEVSKVDETNNQGLQLRLPRLKELKCEAINNIEEQPGLDFITPLRSLEKLQLGNINNPNVEENENHFLRIQGYLSTLDQSNIWRCFPYLKEVRFFGVEGSWESEDGILMTDFIYRRSGNDVVKIKLEETLG